MASPRDGGGKKFWPTGMMSFYDQSSACERVAGSASGCLGVNDGLTQGCRISLWVHNTYIDGIFKKFMRGRGESSQDGLTSIGEWFLSQLLFADDTALAV